MERKTSQKKTILNYLKSVKTHPSAKTVYLNLKKELPRISKSTVYRILNNFKKKGEIQEILGDVTRYDGDTSPHSHFFCNECGTLFDIFEDYKILTERKIIIGEIKNYQVYFYGTCYNCINNKNDKTKSNL